MLFYKLERQSMTINQKLMGSIISEIFALKQSDAKLDLFNLQFGPLIVCFHARDSLLSFNCVDSGHHGEFSKTDIVSLSSIALTKGWRSKHQLQKLSLGQIHIINSVHHTKLPLSCNTLHRHSSTVYLETYPLHYFHSVWVLIGLLCSLCMATPYPPKENWFSFGG